MDRLETEQRPTPTRQLVAAIALFTFGVLITCVRFPPADLTGWIAHTLGVPLGVPFFVAALLFGGAALILYTSNSRHRVFRVISLIAAIVSAVIGVFTTATFV